MMHIRGGLVRPKSESVDKPLVLPLLFEGSGLPRGDSENEHRSEPDRFLVEKVAKKEQKNRNEPLDMKGKYDAYMFGLGGPKSENVEKPLVFKGFLRGAKGQEHSKSRKK